MRIEFAGLESHLRGAPHPVYLVCGDEPYHFGEAARLIRARARALGFEEREVLDQHARFDWGLLGATAQAMSLFASRRLIELRISTERLGKEGAAALRDYSARPCPDNLLLILAPALERKELTAAWVKAIESQGAVVQVRALRQHEVEPWVTRQLRAAGFAPEPGAAALIAERVEGNLLAAVQEVEKLRLLREPGPLSLDDLMGNLADQARFDLFALTDAAITGQRARAQRVLGVLRAEGTAEVLILWVLARELRLLLQVGQALAAGRAAGSVLETQRVPRPRHGAITQAARRLPLSRLRDLLTQCLWVDEAIKGLRRDDPWLRLAVLIDALAGGPLWQSPDVAA